MQLLCKFLDSFILDCVASGNLEQYQTLYMGLSNTPLKPAQVTPAVFLQASGQVHGHVSSCCSVLVGNERMQPSSWAVRKDAWLLQRKFHLGKLYAV